MGGFEHTTFRFESYSTNTVGAYLGGMFEGIPHSAPRLMHCGLKKGGHNYGPSFPFLLWVRIYLDRQRH